ncbi:MAG: tetratricopeptide repeat protein, partial [Alphaproteobacteria bacterium]|nr:tetratricopeptide repeat protein [Alphaproteobacteria bacterium]
EAIDLIERAVARDGARANYWRDLAAVRDAAGDRMGALASVRQSVRLDARDAEAWALLGALALGNDAGADSLAESEAALTLALAIAPDHEQANENLAVVLTKTARWTAAEELLRKQLAAWPRSPSVWHNFAYYLREQSRFDEGLAAIRRSLALRPGWRESVLLLASLCEENGQSDEAVAIYRQAIATNPDDAEAHFSLGCALLNQGAYAEGWREYEWRWSRDETRAHRPRFDMPPWDGSPLEGRTILLHAEQGAGDTFQFARFIPLVKARGSGRIILECNRDWHAVLRSVAAIDQLIGKGEARPPFDAHCVLLSLPLTFGTTLDVLPAPVRYLRADPARVAAWGERLAGLPRPRVGLCWQGNPRFKADRRRSPPLSVLAPLVGASRASFVSIHKGAGEAQIPASGIADRLTVLPGIEDFADTAAIIDNLDLVVTSDTSIAHLAGALGKTTWTMLSFAPDWRWHQKREDSPWYPSMRLFRQREPGNWAEVVARVARALEETFAGDLRGPLSPA